MIIEVTVINRAIGSGPASPVWPDHFFTQAQKKVPCRLQSVLYGRAEKIIEVQ